MATRSLFSQPIGISGIGPICPGVTSLPELLALETGSDGAFQGRGNDWFDPVRFLGKRGFKYLTPATRYALGATQVALDAAHIAADTYTPEERGVIIGTNFAVAGVHAAMDAVIMTEGADALSPMEAANFSVNLAASHISMKHSCKAFNISLTTPMVAGVEALILGANAIRYGRAQMVVAGATEDTPLPQAADALGVPVASGAACAVVLEPAARARERQAPLYAIVGEGILRFAHPQALEDATAAQRLVNLLRHDLTRLLPPELSSVYYCPLTAPFPVNRRADAIVQEVLAERGITTITSAFVGATGAFITVSPLLQLGALVAQCGAGLLLATSPHGHIALVMLHPAPA